MRVYHHESGRVYDGEPVDCREMMLIGGFVKEPPQGGDVTSSAPPEESGGEQLRAIAPGRPSAKVDGSPRARR